HGRPKVKAAVIMAAIPELKTAALDAPVSSGTIWSSRISAFGCEKREYTRSIFSPSFNPARPPMMSKARSAASGLEKTYVELRKTAGRAEPTERLGSKPSVRTAVDGRTESGKPGRCDIITPLLSL